MKLRIAVLFLAAVACNPSEPAQQAKEPDHAALIVDDEKQLKATLQQVAELFARADHFTLYRIANAFDKDYEQIAKDTQERIAGYPILGQSTLQRQKAAPITNLLVQRSTYLPPGDAWMCLFEPHHVLRATGKYDSAIVVICVKCGDVEIRIGDKPGDTRSLTPAANAELTRILDGI